MNISATELPNFIRKYYLLHEILIFNASVHSVHKHRTSSLQLCGQPTVLTLTQSTTRFRGSCRSVCTATRFVTSTSWSRAWSKSGNISTRWSSMKRSGSGVHVFELVFEHRVDILNTDFRCADVLPFAWTHTWQSITPVPMLDTYAFEWPY